MSSSYPVVTTCQREQPYKVSPMDITEYDAAVLFFQEYYEFVHQLALAFPDNTNIKNEEKELIQIEAFLKRVAKETSKKILRTYKKFIPSIRPFATRIKAKDESLFTGEDGAKIRLFQTIDAAHIYANLIPQEKIVFWNTLYSLTVKLLMLNVEENDFYKDIEKLAKNIAKSNKGNNSLDIDIGSLFSNKAFMEQSKEYLSKVDVSSATPGLLNLFEAQAIVPYEILQEAEKNVAKENEEGVTIHTAMKTKSAQDPATVTTTKKIIDSVSECDMNSPDDITSLFSKLGQQSRETDNTINAGAKDESQQGKLAMAEMMIRMSQQKTESKEKGEGFQKAMDAIFGTTKPNGSVETVGCANEFVSMLSCPLDDMSSKIRAMAEHADFGDPEKQRMYENHMSTAVHAFRSSLTSTTKPK